MNLILKVHCLRLPHFNAINPLLRNYFLLSIVEFFFHVFLLCNEIKKKSNVEKHLQKKN